jgi:hypothetical protein
VTEGDLLVKAYNIVAPVYLLLGGELCIVNIAGKLDKKNNSGLVHLFDHIKEEFLLTSRREA